MAGKFSRGAPKEIIYLSDTEDHSAEDFFPDDLFVKKDEEEKEAVAREEANNRRLREAINYITAKGGSDSADLYAYANRIQEFDNLLVQRYANEGRLYDPRLHRKLADMVRHAKANIERDRVDSETGDLGEGLYRDIGASKHYIDEEVASDYDGMAREKRAGKAPVRKTKGPSMTRPARTQKSPNIEPPDSIDAYPPIDRDGVPGTVQVKKQWLYGGPNNDLEKYHKHNPASLPFGETLYMQEWESMKIDYDLREGAKRKSGDGAVITKVDYDAVKLPASSSKYESGSRFKLPELRAEWKAWVKKEGHTLDLQKVIVAVNRGGLDHSTKAKDYAPRLWLPRVSISSKSVHSKSGRARSVSPGSHKRPPSSPSPSSSSSSSGGSGRGVTGSDTYRVTKPGNSVKRKPSPASSRADVKPGFDKTRRAPPPSSFGRHKLDPKGPLDGQGDLVGDMAISNKEIRRQTARLGSISAASGLSIEPRTKHVPAAPSRTNQPRGPRESALHDVPPSQRRSATPKSKRSSQVNVDKSVKTRHANVTPTAAAKRGSKRSQKSTLTPESKSKPRAAAAAAAAVTPPSNRSRAAGKRKISDGSRNYFPNSDKVGFEVEFKNPEDKDLAYGDDDFDLEHSGPSPKGTTRSGSRYYEL
ncbi:hypothetical protein K504DRAFT_534068 [Pleomassaria siparia CBS 279.74]|uniref:Uncharacterized protein n=1 Tax=Pleomassaria siparia CBS 279.74 TaxID=1314801 RepID=A0A6G1KA25_9PLEO|nr:hypothetical protein K504DRAFT_534068 [Pleomassaria siparia CBS 279.74]